MRLNDDLSIRTLVHAAVQDWAPSPSNGVDRRMLFCIGEEKARATSIVRYAPGSCFEHRGHPGGEEFFVLEGTFRDETGDFPAGSCPHSTTVRGLATTDYFVQIASSSSHVTREKSDGYFSRSECRPSVARRTF